MYEFDTWNGAMKLGWKSKDGKKYYYTSSGIAKGECRINGNWYYFDEVTAVMQTGWVKHHEHTYYYNSDGIMQYGEN